MESSTRLPHCDPQPTLAILPAPVFTRYSVNFFAFPPQLAPSAQIIHTAPFARSTEPTRSADCFRVCVFTPGHRFYCFAYAAPRRLMSASLITKRALSRATSLARPAAFTESSTASKSL